MKQHFDVIVIGGGHAGVEAACMAARRGSATAIVTFNPGVIGSMSCNPSIGGVGKGHIVREVDAFDGVMARAADQAAIHYRMLNASKGTAVHGPRIQADRRRYRAAVQSAVATAGIATIQGEVTDLLFDGHDQLAGVILEDDSRITAPAVVLATGTFLGGRMFRGDELLEGGRQDEAAANRLGQRLRALDLPVGRLKTGTPPRLDGRSIDWAAMAEQPSDDGSWTMSPLSTGRPCPQVACAITATDETTHAIVADAADRSPLFSGAIAGPGPRYCPSIEDKVRRFADRPAHQLFLEPEGLDDHTVYPNGLSTSLPRDVQQRIVQSIAGLEHTRILDWGYAVEYDYLDPRSLDHRLGLTAIPGVFCAGQINGTTGYEEAAGQGLVAGANAAAHALQREPLRLSRSSSYIGVMIDDLVLQGVSEPYRMLTARAEYRLSLRPDNAETRLGGIARAIGCISEERLRHQERRTEVRLSINKALDRCIPPRTLRHRGIGALGDKTKPIREWLTGAGVEVEWFEPELQDWIGSDALAECVADARYAPYLSRQAREMEQLAQGEARLLPGDINYAAIAGLSTEMIERLSTSRPPSLAAAGRVRGVTPAALTAILLHVRRHAA